MLTGESWFHISTPQGFWTWVPLWREAMGSPLDQWDRVRKKWDCRLSTGLPPSSRLRQLWSRKGDLQRAWNQDWKAVWDQVGLSHYQHEGLVTIQDEACLRRGHNDQSRWGHQCSETTLTGESRFHRITPLGIWTRVPCDGKQRVVHWTSETWWEWSEIAGSPHNNYCYGNIPMEFGAFPELSGYLSWLLWLCTVLLLLLHTSLQLIGPSFTL